MIGLADHCIRARIDGQALKAQCAQRHLRFDAPMLRCSLEPSCGLGSTRGNARAFEIASCHPVLSIDDAGFCGPRKQREGLGRPSAFAQSDRLSQARRRRCEANNPIYDIHFPKAPMVGITITFASPYRSRFFGHKLGSNGWLCCRPPP